MKIYAELSLKLTTGHMDEPRLQDLIKNDATNR